MYICILTLTNVNTYNRGSCMLQAAEPQLHSNKTPKDNNTTSIKSITLNQCINVSAICRLILNY